MNATIYTATVTVGTKETPLTKAIVNQIPFAETEFMDNEHYASTGDCKVLGEVQIDNGKSAAFGYNLLISTPRGVRRLDSHYKAALNNVLHRDGCAPIERIILTK